MDKVFLDTNILLDHLLARTPFDLPAKTILERAERGQIIACASALSFCNIAYILRKLAPGTNVPQILSDLSKIVVITPIGSAVITDALESSFKDFEDAVQHFSAVRFGGISHLLTRNPADFAFALLPVVSPADYLLKYP